MKIVHILDNLERGGAQTVLRSLVAGLARLWVGQVAPPIAPTTELLLGTTLAPLRAPGLAVALFGLVLAFVGAFARPAETRTHD